MTAFILPDDGSGRIVTFDAIESELHEKLAEATEHPVETGANISDHVRPLPDTFQMSAVVSNTPIESNPFTQRGELQSFKLNVPQWTPPLEATPGSLFRSAISAVDGALFGSPERSITILSFPEPFDAIVETYEILLELLSNAIPLRIITSLRDYEDMVLLRVAAPRNAGDASVAFGIDVRKLRVVESGQVTAPPTPADDVPGGKPLANKGGQGAKPPSTGEDDSKGGSIAFNILSGQGLI